MRRTLLSLIAITFAMAEPALAQEAAEGRPPSHCNRRGAAVNFRSVVPPETVRISYIDHSMFLIQTPGGLSVATDYNGFIRPTDFTPDVVTMIRQPH